MACFRFGSDYPSSSWDFVLVASSRTSWDPLGMPTWWLIRSWVVVWVGLWFPLDTLLFNASGVREERIGCSATSDSGH